MSQGFSFQREKRLFTKAIESYNSQQLDGVIAKLKNRHDAERIIA